MNEHWKFLAVREYCRTCKLKYHIKNDALFVYVPQVHKYIQTCFSIYNFKDEIEIRQHIFNVIKEYSLNVNN
jgi:hypothetical protein